MREFGSDFHFVDGYKSDSRCCHYHLDARFYASGRHALEALYKRERWKRIWIPDYFCHEVVAYLLAKGLNIVFYDDNPLIDRTSFSDLDFREGDALFRVNYFGLRAKRNNANIPIPIVEDHTHDLIGHWAIYSDADWCIGSLRKTLPVALGGILWSPKGLTLPHTLEPSGRCIQISQKRYEAMRMKTNYLENGGDKDIFRKSYIETEEAIDVLPLSGLDIESSHIIKNFDVKSWTKRKVDNWHLVHGLIGNHFHILPCEDNENVHPFSVIIVLDSQEEREKFRHYLIQNLIYPAILWRVPETASLETVDFSNRMLSIHCDARYDKTAIEFMCNIINQYD